MKRLLLVLALFPAVARASHPSTCPAGEVILADIDCATSGTGTMVSGTSDLSGYSGATFTQAGPEHVYEFECPANGTAKIQLLPASCDFDLFVLDDTCSPASSLGDSELGGTAMESVSITCTVGDYVYAVVEGWAFQSG